MIGIRVREKKIHEKESVVFFNTEQSILFIYYINLLQVTCTKKEQLHTKFYFVNE